MKKSSNVVKTPFGDIPIIRKGTVAISVIKTKRDIRHYWRDRKKGDVVHLEHRVIPRSKYRVTPPWANHLGTYDLLGIEIKMIDV